MQANQLVSCAVATALACSLAASHLSAQVLKECENEQLGPDVKCGQFTVLENRAEKNGRKIDLNLMVLEATKPTKKGALFMFAGGPGQGATDLAGLVLGPLAPVREVRDVVLVDQRGTGGSNRIGCPRDARTDPQVAFGAMFVPERIADCLAEAVQHADVRYYTTDHVVEDIDEIRDWLGYDKILLWGGSGGTRTALVYMREFPNRVEGALLDAVAPTDARMPSGFARAAQNSLERVILDCRNQSDCGAAYPDLAAKFDALVARFADGPVETTVTRDDGTKVEVHMHAGDFAYAVRGMLYRSRSIATLPGSIHKASTTGDISDFAQAHWRREVGTRPIVAMGVHLAVYCSEDVPFIQTRELERLSEGTFLGSYLVDQYSAACERWKRGDVTSEYLEPVKSKAPVLLFSGYYDPSTPASYADEVARHLPNSRRVVVRNESHGSEFGCGRELAIAFLRNGTLEGLGTACEDVGPVEFEVQ